MKFGLSYNSAFYGTDPDQMIAIARHAEACGFESFYVPEHIALYPGATVGSAAIPPAIPIADPLVALSFVAAATKRILLGTGVLLVPHHHPVALAKRLATIDVLSKGRMRLLTVGVGALPGEAEAAGIDFASRGRRADEAIDVLRLLWAGRRERRQLRRRVLHLRRTCAAFPSRWPRARCRCTSAAPAGPRRGGLACAEMATSRAGGSPRRSETASWT